MTEPGVLQGYLAHEKLHPPLGPPKGPRYGLLQDPRRGLFLMSEVPLNLLAARFSSFFMPGVEKVQIKGLATQAPALIWGKDMICPAIAGLESFT